MLASIKMSYINGTEEEEEEALTNMLPLITAADKTPCNTNCMHRFKASEAPKSSG